MNGLMSALWAEALKARRSRVPWLTALGFCIAPLVGGLFMIILKDPEAARSMGLISTKAQLTAGTADWPAYFGLLGQATTIGGAILFAIVTSWVFGREFSDRTVKELLARPTSRGAIVISKFAVVLIWAAGLTVFIFFLGLGVGTAVGLPGWSADLLWQAAGDLSVTAGLTLALMSPVALLASVGRGYLPPFGWVILTLFLSQIIAAMGWGSWFPWSVPALFSGFAGSRVEQIGSHSYILVALTSAAGLAGTFAWWYRADQTR